MPGHRHPDIFPGDLGQKLPVHDIAIEADLLIFDRWRGAADIRIRRERRRAVRSYAQRLRQRRSNFIGTEPDFWLGLARSQSSQARCGADGWRRCL